MRNIQIVRKKKKADQRKKVILNRMSLPKKSLIPKRIMKERIYPLKIR